MYMARINGYYEVTAFASTKEKAKRLAIKAKRNRYTGSDEDIKWTWGGVVEYFGAYCIEITDGLVDVN